jgi:hypothetical protein
MCCFYMNMSGIYDNFQNKYHSTMGFVWIFICLCEEFCVFSLCECECLCCFVCVFRVHIMFVYFF